MTFFRAHTAELTLALFALVVHLAVFAFVVDANNGNILAAVRGDDGFYELAENVLAGNGFSWSTAAPYAPNPLRTPGYSYLLAFLIGTVGITGAALVQLLVASSIPPLGSRIARRITSSRVAGHATGIILAADPTLALLSFQFYTETFFLVLFFLWILSALTYLENKDLGSLILGAILLGCAILVRTSAQYFPLLFVVFIMWQHGRAASRRALTHASIYLLIIGAILTPWTLRNVREFGVIGLSAQTPFVLYTNLAPAVLSVAPGSPFADTVDSFLTKDEFLGNAITLTNGATYTTRALDIALSYPRASLFVASKSLYTFFTNDGVYTLLVRGGYKPQDFLPLLVVARLAWIAITLAAFVGAFLYIRARRSARAFFVILLVAFFAISSTIAAFGTNPRYRLPVVPIIIAMALFGGQLLLEYAQALRQRELPQQKLA